MNMHVNRPQDGAQTIPQGLLAQERARQKALRRVAKLRKKAADEIERLIAFLDASDGYSTTEQEPSLGFLETPPSCYDTSQGYGGVYSSEEGHQNRPQGSTDDREQSCEGEGDAADQDDEDGNDSEPSLGSLTSGGGDQARWGARTAGALDVEDEHDGAEPENEHDDRADYEPSLGWTTDGVIGNTGERDCDVETGTSTSRPQKRTVIPGTVKVENSYRRFLHGMMPDQSAALRKRMRERDPYGVAGNVVLR